MGDVKSEDYLLVAMRMDRGNYVRGYDKDGIMHVQFVWEENPEFVEIVWDQQAAKQ